MTHPHTILVGTEQQVRLSHRLPHAIRQAASSTRLLLVDEPAIDVACSCIAVVAGVAGVAIVIGAAAGAIIGAVASVVSVEEVGGLD